MAKQDSDGFFELEFNGDQTQVFATIHPPRGGGKCVTSEEVVSRLKQMGVMYGIREPEISRAIAHVQATIAPVSRILVAQGVLPVEGTDAQISWEIDYAAASEPIPMDPSGAPDYFSVPSARIVTAGQTLATIRSSLPGSPGKTLTAPYKNVPISAPRDLPYGAGAGVTISDERHRFVAEVGGVVQIVNHRILVHALQWVEGDLSGGNHEFASGVVILGDATACGIRAEGPVCIRGTVAGCVIRAKGPVSISRSARTRIMADGDVFVSGKLLHSQVITQQQFVGAPGSLVVGGEVFAPHGVRCDEAGSPNADATLLAVFDRFTHFRQQEVDTEIAQYEESIQRIVRGLRPLLAGGQEGVSDQKRELAQKLGAQRRRLETRVRDLHHEKRSLIMATKTRAGGEIAITGTIHRGVTVQVGTAAATVDGTRSRLRFSLDASRDAVTARPLEDSLAA